MHHSALNNTSQFLTYRISSSRDFGTDETINIGSSQELVISLQKHQPM